MFDDGGLWPVLIAAASFVGGAVTAVLFMARKVLRTKEDDDEPEDEEDASEAIAKAEKRLNRKLTSVSKEVRKEFREEIAALRRDLFGPYSDV